MTDHTTRHKVTRDGWTLVYTPVCSCGWEGRQVLDVDQCADACAEHHAEMRQEVA